MPLPKLPRLLPPSSLARALLSSPSFTSPHPQIIPINSTWFMPNDPAKRTGITSHSQLRLPHSRFFDIDTIKDTTPPNDKLPHMLPSPSVFVEAMRKLRIRKEDHLVFYDSWENGILSAPRAAWTARVLGHPEELVSVLNNFKVYVEDSVGPVEKGEEGLGDFESRELGKEDEYPDLQGFAKEAVVASYQEMLELARENAAAGGKEGKVQILDARPNGRFTGRDPEPRPGLSSGHIPGSLSVPFSDLLDGRKALLQGEELRKVLESKGVRDDGGAKVASCGTGVTAAVVELALVEAGFKAGEGRRVYDGSWTEWAGKVPEEGDGETLIVKD